MFAIQNKPTTAAQRFEIDPMHASAQFKVRHLMVSHVRGELGPISGIVELDLEDLARSSVRAEIDVKGLDTKNAQRDDHLRSPDFLDVANHPVITFASTAVKPAGVGALKVTGDLTIRGVTRPVTLDVELSDEITDPWGNAKRGASGHTRLHRKDFGVSFNALMESGGLVVGDTVEVTLELELVRR
jgi:polyisoprenoid-binding protein YceI